MATETVCGKCGYVRQEADVAPDYECPRCGVVYAKAAAAKAAAVRATDPPVTPAVEAASTSVSRLVTCEACGRDVSFAAACCPGCGHPNPEAPNTTGIIAGLVAVSLAVSALWVPYFAAPFVIPAAIAAALAAFVLRTNWLPTAALLLASIALVGVYQTSKEIRKAGDEMKKHAEQFERDNEAARRNAAAAQRQWEQELEKLRRNLTQ